MTTVHHNVEQLGVGGRVGGELAYVIVNGYRGHVGKGAGKELGVWSHWWCLTIMRGISRKHTGNYLG